jgi:transglutaminase-like putative cysteine protease
MRGGPSENLLRAGIAAIVVFATLMLAVGERTVVLTLVSLVAVVVSLYVTDVTRSFQLSQAVANYVALGVVAVSAANMLTSDRAGQIIAVANLQSYLQLVLLFQPKTARVYWHLALLSLGQVAIASTLVPGPLFGAMLLVYLLLGVVTFALLLLHTEAARCAPALTVAWDGATAGASLSGRAPVLSGAVAAGPRGIGRALLGQIAAVAGVTLAVAALTFFMIPRWTIRSREVPTNEPLRAVGFSKTITLGELGEVVQNPDVVMRIEFFRGHSLRPFKLVDEPRFRGSVVTHYEGGSWTQSRPPNVGALSTNTASPYVRQRITIEPMDVSELFCIVPVFALQGDSRLRIDAGCQQLTRTEDFRGQHMEFEVGTTGIVNDRQREFLPCQRPLHPPSLEPLLQIPQGGEDKPDPFKGLKETAARVLAEKNVDPRDRVAIARALHDYLRFSGEYFYSLERQQRNPVLDPLEDFVTEHRYGHCEYFAGALVMMLRSQRIPARMAIGFKGGEWNSLGMYYQVQQLHAHAWVEVYLDEEFIPSAAFAGDDFHPPAAWMVLDPTVSLADDGDAGQNIGLWARFRQSVDYAQVLWSNYVVGLNAKRQQQGIYGPLQAGVRAAAENLFGREVWARRARAVASSPVGTFWEWYRRHWFSWRGGLVAIVASMLLLACYIGLVWLARALGSSVLARGGRRRHEPPTLEIYRRLEAALARGGFQRQPAQTAHEFALAAGGNLAESIEHRRLSHLPRRVVESFYRVRFGGRTLDNLEAEAVEHALAELERALGRGR